MTKIRINRVYTRSGDAGETGLVGGARVSKSDIRVETFGHVDELGAVLGLVKEKLSPKTKELFAVIEYVQQELFDLGAELSTPIEGRYEGMWEVSEEHVKSLEKLCDSYGKGLPELRSFILSGGSELAALLHVARTVARRSERNAVRLLEKLQEAGQGELFNTAIISYLNRLSDLLFIIARWTLLADQKEAPLWVQDRDRKLPAV